MLTINDGVLFRTRSFHPDYRYTANLVDAWSVDEIVLLDITRPGGGDKANFFGVVTDLAAKCFVPLTAGGGIRCVDDIKAYLGAGADKIAVNTGAIENPSLIENAARLFGSQCVVVSIDARLDPTGAYEVYSCFGSERTGLRPETWAREAQARGAGEILISSIDRDGTLEGYDNRLNRLVSDAVDIPVLVCGGAGKWQDFVDGFVLGKASAVCTTNIYHFTEASILSAKKFLQSTGIPVRI